MDLKTYIKGQRITQAEFSERVGVTPQYLSNVMNGNRPPGKVLVAAIFGATGGDVDGADEIRNEGKSHEPL